MQHVRFVLVADVKNAIKKAHCEPSLKSLLFDFPFIPQGSGFGREGFKTDGLGLYLSDSLRPVANGCRG
jgi:hypothetical protein